MQSEKKSKKQYNEHGDASHYMTNRINNIHIMEQTWGTLGVMLFCEMNAFKYKDRIGKKKDQPIEQELLKISWYEKAAAYYHEKLQDPERCIKGLSYYHKLNLPWNAE